MKKYTAGLILFYLILTPELVYAAGEAASEQLLKEAVPRMEIPAGAPEEKGQVLLSSYFEPSHVVQGSRPGRWREITNTIGYKYRNIQGYAKVSQWNRFSVDNYTGHFGAYVNFPNSYVHAEAGWGWDITYMYKFQSIAEYGHRIKGGLYWEAGYQYRNYILNDTYMMYPGLIYYFGDNYVSTNYGLSLMESRGLAQFGILKGNFALGKRFSWLLGTAVGRRLYDIYERSAYKQFGYIIFTGLNINLYDGIDAKVGCSYGTEKPDFIKRSIYAALSAKF